MDIGVFLIVCFMTGYLIGSEDRMSMKEKVFLFCICMWIFWQLWSDSRGDR